MRVIKVLPIFKELTVPMKVELPDKLYFKIGEVGKLADVQTHVLRYWESEFSDISPKRTRSGQRLYRQEDVRLILKIKDLLHHHGYTIAGARKFLESGEESMLGEPESAVNSISPAKSSSSSLHAIKHELQELQDLLKKGSSGS